MWFDFFHVYSYGISALYSFVVYVSKWSHWEKDRYKYMRDRERGEREREGS